jgi:trans-aconitate methyltransferase
MDRYQETFESWNNAAPAYRDNFMHLTLYDDSYNLFCQLIEKTNASIFEIGCGPGNITKYLLDKRPNFAITATDVSPNMIEIAKQNNPTVSFRVMDCREMHTLTEKYDAVMCGFCMPYLSKEDCDKLIKDASALLETGGILYFSAIEGEYNKSGYETSSDSKHKMYVYYHEEKHLLQSLNNYNFNFIPVQRIPYTRKNGTEETHIILMAKKK